MFGIPLGLMPVAISWGSQYIARSVAARAPVENRLATFRRVLMLCGLAAIVGSLVYATASRYTAANPFEKGAGAYHMLGIDARATVKEVGQGFRQASRQLHPDKNPEAKDMYELLSKANDVLRNPEHKFVYDRFGLGAITNLQQAYAGGLKLGDIVSNYSQATFFYWAMSSVWIIFGSFLAGGPLMWQISILMALAFTELTLVTREWFEWPLPLPIFQVVAIVRESVPGILGGLALLTTKHVPELQQELNALQNATNTAQVLAMKRFDEATAPFQQNEKHMIVLQNAANASL